ncbi:hypothetical protein QVD17_18436 [Tagetes erecta]|uniref:Uncharacterized protein n=1 Tax=Tagetes erecta TaxID=13708 RepID=A0AAD8KKM2_TARER|nr:hypothetical protein QVD17_18436 [Tagetes erecta]
MVKNVVRGFFMVFSSRSRAGGRKPRHDGSSPDCSRRNLFFGAVETEARVPSCAFLGDGIKPFVGNLQPLSHGGLDKLKLESSLNRGLDGALSTVSQKLIEPLN